MGTSETKRSLIVLIYTVTTCEVFSMARVFDLFCISYIYALPGVIPYQTAFSIRQNGNTTPAKWKKTAALTIMLLELYVIGKCFDSKVSQPFQGTSDSRSHRQSHFPSELAVRV